MKAPKIAVAGLALVFALSLLTVFAQTTPEKKQGTKKPEAKKVERIPKEIEAIMQEGLATRQGRQDIPFSIFKYVVYPALDNNFYPEFLFKAKNSALDYAPVAGNAGQLESRPKVFLQFSHEDATGVLKAMAQAKVDPIFATESASYDPEKEEWYSFGIALPAGKYVLSMAIATADLKKVGVAYCNFELMGPETYKSTLVASEVFFCKSMDQIQPDRGLAIHKSEVTWGGLKIVPIIPTTITVGDNLNVIFFIYGGTPGPAEAGQRPQYNFEVAYEVQKEDGQAAIKWTPQNYVSYLICQEFPLVQTLSIKDDKGERQETRPLTAGKFILVAQITDKISGLKLDIKAPFEVK